MLCTGYISLFICLLMFHKQVVGSCPDNCAECFKDGDSQKCDKCNYGYWLIEGSYCLSCPDKCEQCTNATKCTKCRPEYWDIRPNMICGSPCLETCTASGCNDTTGYCFGCQPGFYGHYCDYSCNLCIDKSCNLQQCKIGCLEGYHIDTDNGFECKKCNSHCQLCVSLRNCTKCERGYYLFSYENSGDNFCSPCSQLCEECISYNECVCQSGKYGPTCSKNCNILNCKNCRYVDSAVRCTECTERYTVMDGSCIPKTNACSQYCSNGCDINKNCLGGCQDGWTGQKCAERCSNKCRKCAQSDETNCEICNGDFYTGTCTVQCNIKCAALKGLPKCSIYSGTCLNGCDKGYWGDKCDKSCYEGCSSDSCNQADGFCDKCVRTHYGDSCQYICNGRCIDNIASSAVCYKANGTCVDGCKNGYEGNTCEDEHKASTMLSSTEKLDRQYDDSYEHDSFAKIFLLGMVAGVGICLLGLVVFVAVRKIRRRRKQSNGIQLVGEERQYENTAVSMQDVNTTVTENVRSNAASDQTSGSIYDSLDVDRRDEQHQYSGLERRADYHGTSNVNI